MEPITKRRDLIIIIGLALLVRLAFNWGFATDRTHADIASMFEYSLRVSRGVFYGEGVYWPPAFIFLSGGLIYAFGASRYWAVIRGVNSILGALTAGLMYDVAGHAFDDRAAAIISGLLGALYLPLVYYTGLAFSETLFLFFLFASLRQMYRLARSRSSRDAAAAGVLLGLATLTRPITLLLPVLLVMWYWLLWSDDRRLIFKQVGLVTVVMLLTLMPWTVRNYVVTGQLVLVDMNGGVNFYIGHNEEATGTWMDLGQKTNEVILLGGSPEAGRLGFRRGLQFIKDHPRAELALAARKFHWFWSKPSDWYISRWARQHRYPHLEPPVWGLAAVAGALLTGRRWRGTLFLILFVAYYNAIIVAVYFACRYRLVVEPVWLILAAGGAAVLGRRVLGKSGR